MPADYSRIHRLLKIITLVQAEAGWSPQRLAQECGVTERTIFRDLKTIEGAGVPVHHDADADGYRIRRDFFLPPVTLTFEESLALIAITGAFSQSSPDQLPMLRAAASAVAKVRSMLPPTLQDELDRLQDHIKIKFPPSGADDDIKDVYGAVQQAITERRTLTCRYDKAHGDKSGNETTFVLEPYTLFFSQRAWYVIGRRADRDGLRNLKLVRFSSIQLNEASYEIPEDFSLESHLGNAWRMIRGKTHQVRIRFDESFAETVTDTIWHAQQRVEWQDDGSVTFQCRVDGLDEIVWWVLGMGPAAKVEHPPELADRVAELARGVAAHYA